MSWDPKIAVVLYQPIDFAAIAKSEAQKTIDRTHGELKLLAEEVSLHAPTHVEWNGRLVRVTPHKDVTTAHIDKLEEILSSLTVLNTDLNAATQGIDISAVYLQEAIAGLSSVSTQYIIKHSQLLKSQNISSIATRAIFLANQPLWPEEEREIWARMRATVRKG